MDIKIPKILYICLGIVIIILSVINIHSRAMESNFIESSNSDLLYPHALLNDLFSKDTSVKNWNLSPSPCFFPDLLIYFILYLFIKDPGLILLFYSFAISIFIVWLIFILINKLSKNKNPELHWLYSSSSFSLFLYSLHFYPIRLSLFSYPGYHGSIYLYFICILIVLVNSDNLNCAFRPGELEGQTVTRNSLKLQALAFMNSLDIPLVVYTIIFAVSDFHAIIQIIMPLLFTPTRTSRNQKGNSCQFEMKFTRKGLVAIFRSKNKSIISSIVIGTFVSIFGFNLLKYLNYFHIPDLTSFDTIKSNLLNGNYLNLINVGYPFLLNEVNKFPLHYIFFISIIILIIFQDSASISALMPFLKRKENSKELISISRKFMLRAVSFLIISFIVLSFMQFFLGVWIGYRYMWSIYLIPIILLYYYILIYLPDRLKLMPSLILLALWIISSSKISIEGNAYNIYPPRIKCLDELSLKYKLDYGISDYWNSKTIRIFSRNNVKTNQFTSELKEYYWINNSDWYYYPDLKNKIKYNFIIYDGLSREIILKKIGKPDIQENCLGMEIGIYNAPLLLH